jgi:hypothetical protein
VQPSSFAEVGIDPGAGAQSQSSVQLWVIRLQPPWCASVCQQPWLHRHSHSISDHCDGSYRHAIRKHAIAGSPFTDVERPRPAAEHATSA